jgi:predicted O-methyltransferase YrrM
MPTDPHGAARRLPARAWPLTLREEAGVPAVPPAVAVRATARLRGMLATLNDRLGLPMQVLLERLTGALDAPALRAFVELDLPDRLDRPSTPAELAAACGCDPDALDRLLAYLASRGCVRRDRRGRYSANRVTRLLTRSGGWSGWVQFLGAPWTMTSYAHLLEAVRDGTDPIVASHGVDFFTYIAAHPEAADAFHQAMAAGARLQALMIEGSLDLRDARAVLDVGGSTGPLLAQLLSSQRTITGAVLDLAEARDGAVATFAEARVSDRAEFITGDFFESVPRGFDVHVITAVLHDWSDHDCVRILRNCVTALEPSGRIIVVDSELEPGVRNAFAQATDALMLAFTPGGRERTAVQFGALWQQAGLTCVDQATLPSLLTRYELRPV